MHTKTSLAAMITLALSNAVYAATNDPVQPTQGGAATTDAAPASPHTITGNVGLVSQYVFRGLTQSNERPAIQGGFDYAHRSGFYAGIWASSISWFSDQNAGNTSSVEIDLYTGFKGGFAKDFTYDVGFIRYQYPGRYPNLPAGVVKPNTNEIYAGIGWKWLMLKYSHSLDDTFGVANSRGSHYLDLSATFEIADKLTLGLHAGRQEYRGAATTGAATSDSLYSYTDYKISLNKEYNGFNFGIAYTDTNANPAGYTVLGKNLGRRHFILSLSKTF